MIVIEIMANIASILTGLNTVRTAQPSRRIRAICVHLSGLLRHSDTRARFARCEHPIQSGDSNINRTKKDIKDRIEETEQLKKMAGEGSLKAQFALGFIYDCCENYSKSREYFFMAAEKGHLGAQHALGYRYYKGKGVPKDHTEALKWWRGAAKGGYEYSIKALKKMAGEGNLKAQFALGFIYDCCENYSKSREYFFMAAEKGHLGAQHALGYRYYKGKGVPKDHTEALKWWRGAAKGGYEHSIKALKYARRDRETIA